MLIGTYSCCHWQSGNMHRAAAPCDSSSLLYMSIAVNNCGSSWAAVSVAADGADQKFSLGRFRTGCVTAIAHYRAGIAIYIIMKVTQW